MRRSFLYTTVTALIFAGDLFAQESCKVLLPAISGTYKGSCKKGLADGPGESAGVDKYAGEFKKGYPYGKGTYIWSTGETYTGDWKAGLRDGEGAYHFKYEGKDSLLTGLWKDDRFIGPKRVDPYVIEYRNGIGRITCIRVGDRPYVKYQFTRGGGESNIASNISMQGSSGTESQGPAFTGFEQVKFPFKGKITFVAPNAFNAAMINCELRITINEPGSWLINMSL